MINFIVCDDDTKTVKNVSQIIDQVMINNDIDYKTHTYYDYDKSFISDIVNTKLPNKVYILDIQVGSHSGIDVARKIRKTDLDSVIIFLTSFNELGMNVISDELMVLTFINKLDNGDKRLSSAIEKSLKVLNVKKLIRFKDSGIVYSIPSDDILYITRDTVERKSIIKTDYSEFKIKTTLTELLDLLGTNFKSSHRSCIINMKRVIKIDKRNRIITFDTGETTDLMSGQFKKEVGI